MAHSKPTTIANRGDAWRVTTVAGYFIIELCTDKRVQTVYWTWRALHMEQARLEDQFRALARRRLSPTEIERRVRETRQRTLPLERQGMQRHLREAVPQLKPAWLGWVNDALFDLFEKAEYQSHHPDDPQQFKIPVVVFPDTPKGKQPGASRRLDLERNVRWFFRATLQEQPDSKHDMARDYASYVGRDNDCFSVVKNGIDQVEAILDLVADQWPTMKNSLFEK